MGLVCILGSAIIAVWYLWIILYYPKMQKEKDDKNWEEIMEHNRVIRKEANKRINEFSRTDKVWARRSDYHKLERGEIINYEGTSVFLQYFNIKFENGDIQSINYFSIKKRL